MRSSPRRIAGAITAVLALAALALSVGHGHWLQSPPPAFAAEHAATARLDQPDAVCASCHQAIFLRYEKTAMARGSGLATDELIPGQFHHSSSGVDYRVFLRDGAAWMSFGRDRKSPGGALSGERQLRYFIGSGHRGRTYLYQVDGRWFELPINFYTRRDSWNMAPAFDDAGQMPDELPADPNCLHCHATDVQAALPTARNRFPGAPFEQGGIGCSACHGNPSAHLAQHGNGPILNPGKLSPARRDSACIQCHLEGDAVVYRPGRSLAQFQPGDDLADFAVYFVKARQPGVTARATSQYEALLRSACKRASGDQLTCTTCHDPHSSPSPAERVEYFRARCLTCHTAAGMAAHHPEQRDCATCHMPTRSTSDISHEQVTDHDIEARPARHGRDLLQTADLVTLGGVPADDRTLGLAYAQRRDATSQARALHFLKAAQLGGANDLDLLSRLGYLSQVAGDTASARTAYAAALQTDPYDPTALGNLAIIDAAGGRTREAVHLLERLIDADPSRTAAGLNLVFIDCSLGRREAALDLTRRLLVDNPDSAPLREFLQTGSYGGDHCTLSPAPK